MVKLPSVISFAQGQAMSFPSSIDVGLLKAMHPFRFVSLISLAMSAVRLQSLGSSVPHRHLHSPRVIISALCHVSTSKPVSSCSPVQPSHHLRKPNPPDLCAERRCARRSSTTPEPCEPSNTTVHPLHTTARHVLVAPAVFNIHYQLCS